jgi:hypothetical protein
MKTPLSRLAESCSVLLLTVLGLVGTSGVPCHAQAVKQVTEKETTVRETRVDGLLHLSGPDSVTIRTGKSDPATYRFGDSIEFVDESGKIVAREKIAVGTPVSVVTTSNPAGGIVASRVIVRQSTAVTTTPGTGTAVTTTTVTETAEKPTKVSGVVVEREADRVLVKTEEDGNVTFLYSQDTGFIDSEGKHVDLVRIVPGLPVQVDFKQVGDRLEASRVMIQGRLKD